VHWSGPTVVQDHSEHNFLVPDDEHKDDPKYKVPVFVPDYDRMAEVQLIEIWLPHDAVAEFMSLPTEPRAAPASEPKPKSKPAPTSIQEPAT
jgi:hypothetical protein